MSRVWPAEMARHEQQQIAKSEAGDKTKLSPDADGGTPTPQFGSRRQQTAAAPCTGQDETAMPVPLWWANF